MKGSSSGFRSCSQAPVVVAILQVLGGLADAAVRGDVHVAHLVQRGVLRGVDDIDADGVVVGARRSGDRLADEFVASGDQYDGRAHEAPSVVRFEAGGPCLVRTTFKPSGVPRGSPEGAEPTSAAVPPCNALRLDPVERR